MSGGHFNYQQYAIGEIAKTIEQDIARALQPKPDMVHENYWTIIEMYSPCAWQSYRGHMTFSSYEEAESFLLANGTVERADRTYPVSHNLDEGTLYQSTRSYMVDTRDKEEIPILYSIHHYVADHYPYDADVLDLTSETIETMKEAYRQIKIAEIYAQRVDRMISGDDNEESLQRRLNEELESFEEDFRNKDWTILDE